MAAWNLTRQGVDVLLLDAGTKFDRAKYWTHVRPWEARERRARGEQPPTFFLDTKEQPYATPEGKHFDLYRVWGHGGKTNIWGRVSLRALRPRLPGPGQGRLGDPLADHLRRHLALLRPGRAADRRLRRHRRFRLAAGQQASCSRRRRRAAPSACCRRRAKGIGIDIVAGPPRQHDEADARLPGLPSLRQLRRRLRHGVVLQLRRSPAAVRAEDRQARDPLERRRGADPRRRQGPRQGRPVLRSRDRRRAAGARQGGRGRGRSCVDSTRILLNSKSPRIRTASATAPTSSAATCASRSASTSRGCLPPLAGTADAQRSRHRRRAHLHAALQSSRRPPPRLPARLRHAVLEHRRQRRRRARRQRA